MKLRKTSVAKYHNLDGTMYRNYGSAFKDSNGVVRSYTRPPWMHSGSVTRISRPSGKGRFGKRPSSVYLEKERHISDNSNDSGLECDWNSQSETQFGWSNSYPGSSVAGDVHPHAVTDFTALKLNPSISAKFGFPNFKTVEQKVDCSFMSLGSIEEDLLDGRRKFNHLNSANILSKTMPSPTSSSGRIASDNTLTSNIHLNSSTVSASPVPVKRPRFGMVSSGASKGSGLKLRNQNGVQVKNSLGKRLPPGTTPTLTSNLSSMSSDGRVYLQILSQPEEQHRARYQTEGSRGAIKDRKSNGFPTVKLFGYDKPATLQIFIGTDQGKASPHMFYQACKVTGKSSTPCIEKKVEGTVMIEIEFEPSKDMTISCDCVGILKERNVDVEQRFPFHHASATQSRKKSTKCRMVFRTTIINSTGLEETLQVSSLPILCTQPPGQPEICKQSLHECHASGGKELFIIGKNFLKDTKVIFQEETNHGEILWEVKCTPHKDFLQQTHLICHVPSYRTELISAPVECKISVWSGGKMSDAHRFTYIPSISAVPMAVSTINAAAISDSSAQALVQSASGQCLTLSPLRLTDCQQAVDLQGSPNGTVVSPDSAIVGTASLHGSISSNSGMSSTCHLSPTGSLSSPLLSNHNIVCASPPESSLEISTHATNMHQMQAMSYEAPLVNNNGSTFTAVEELNSLLEQSAEESQQCSPVEAVMGDVKQQEMVSGTVIDLKPATSFNNMQSDCNMNLSYTGQATIAMESAGTYNTMTSPFEVESILPDVQIPGMISSGGAGQMNTIVVEQTHHQMMPLLQATNISEGTPMETMVAPHITPLSMSVSCMEPMMKRETVQVAQSTEVQSHPAAGTTVTFMNGELQGPIANALTQMSDNELINYINPSCFDQGAF